MLCRLTLAVLLLRCCCCVEAELMSRLVLPRDYGVKLCGREFIRAVIFTCGGSRWRRSSTLDSLPWTLVSEEHSWNPASKDPPPPPLSSSSTLEELLSVYRTRRNSSLGVAGKCCSQGCTKNDIGQLC